MFFSRQVVPLCCALLVSIAGCSGEDVPVSAGQVGAGDGAGGADGGNTLADGAVLVDGVVGTGDGGGTVKDGGGVLKDGGGALKDGGGTTTKDAGGTTTKDAGGTVKDGGSDPGKDGASGPPDIPGDKDKKYQSCPDLFTCAQVACDYDPKPGCHDICTENAAWAAKQALSPYATCLWDNCYAKNCVDSKDTKACVQECNGLCGGLIYQCLADGATGKTTCSTAWSCMESCNAPGKDDFQCAINCYKNMDAASQAQFDDVFACMAKEPPGDAAWAACVDKLLKCAGDGSTGPESCLDMVKCTGTCDKGLEDLICSGKCYGKGTAAAQKTYAEVFACYAAAEGSSGAQTKCMDKVLACSEPSGKLGCMEVWPCVESCKAGKPGDGGVCMFDCLGQATPKGAKAFLEVMACSEANKGDSTKCVDSTVACVEPTGTLICTKIGACMGTCVAGGKEAGLCYLECLKKGSVKETKAFLAQQACNDVKCKPECKDKPAGTEQDNCNKACANEKCKAEQLACLG